MDLFGYTPAPARPPRDNISWVDASLARWQAKKAKQDRFKNAIYPPAPPENPSPLISLDHHETSERGLPTPSFNQRARFASCSEQRRQVHAAMLHVEPNSKTIHRFETCGRDCSVVVDCSNGKHEIRVFTCGQRMCPTCMHRRRAQLEERLSLKMPAFKEHEWKFITLTLRSSDFPLQDQLDHLVHSFRNLRRRVQWLSHARYGWAVLEVTFNSRTRQWHPHFHLIVNCSFWAHHSLSKAWSESSGGSPVCDIRPIGSGVARVKYVTKYIGKPPDFSQAPDPGPLYEEYYRAMKHRRMLIKYGVHPKSIDKVSEATPAEAKAEYLFVCTLEQLIEQVRNGRKESLRILHEIFPDSKNPIYKNSGLPPP